MDKTPPVTDGMWLSLWFIGVVLRFFQFLGSIVMGGFLVLTAYQHVARNLFGFVIMIGMITWWICVSMVSRSWLIFNWTQLLTRKNRQ